MAVDLLSPQALATVLISAVSLIVWRLTVGGFGSRKYKLPPLVEYKWPILGSTFDFIKDPTAFTVNSYEKYGPVFRVYFRGYVQAVVGKEHVRDIFLNPAFSYELIPVYKDFAASIGHFVNRKSPVLALLPSVAKLYMWTRSTALNTHHRVKFNLSSPTAVYRAKVLKYTMPIVHERRRLMKELGDEYDPPAYLNTVPLDQPVNEHELATMMLTLVFFSIHTTTKRTTICLYNLAKYPQYVPELLEEQRAVLGDDWADGTVTLDQLKNLNKLDSFIRESLRTSGRSIALPHKIVGMDEWHLPGGYVLPKGTVVNINTEDVYYSPELQGPNPREFNAWRFVGTDKGAARIGPDMIAFGLGRHACPGRFFAVHEMKIALSLILKRYSVTFPDGVKPTDGSPLLFTPRKTA
ncbi:predicted protein [Postia placenta Mad-698-R]|nr:predicted protein [Postia placenta Mad-698-R]